MYRTLLIELSGDEDQHYTVNVPFASAPDDMWELTKIQNGISLVSAANVIIDTGTGAFIKSRYVADRKTASAYEIKWFMRGGVKRVTVEELRELVEVLHRNW